MRTKEFLGKHQIPFLSRNVLADEGALEELLALGTRQLPVISRGTDWVNGQSLKEIARLVGIDLGIIRHLPPAELVRRVDPRHRTLGQLFQDEIATPLGLDAYIRLPDAIPQARLATLSRPAAVEMLRNFPLRLALEAMNRRSNICRALVGSALPHDNDHTYARNLEVPSGGAVCTARALARAYGIFATGGRELGLRHETLRLLAAPAIPPARGFYDECMKASGVQFALGFMKSSAAWPFGRPGSYGAPGSGGSLGFADPAARVGYGYVTSQMGTRVDGDPRDRALRDALYSAIRP